MKTIRIGIFGVRRGSDFFKSILSNNGEIVAVCEKNQERVAEALKQLGNHVTVYDDFDKFIEHPMDAVLIANYFHEHAEYAIKCLEKNIHVLSECTSNATMAEGVALVRAVEKSKAIYMLSENYPFMRFNVEMRRVFRSGALGKLIYAEGEYNHPIDPFDNKEIKGLRPYRTHWRNCLPRSYYITHSLAPLMHITGAVPVRVTAMPCYVPFPNDSLLNCNVNDRAAIITCLNDDDSVFRVTGCAAFGGHNNFYRVCGEKGQIENRIHGR
jgi:predicted dehydrogenase